MNTNVLVKSGDVQYAYPMKEKNTLGQCFSTRATIRTCADEKNCGADDERGADE